MAGRRLTGGIWIVVSAAHSGRKLARHLNFDIHLSGGLSAPGDHDFLPPGRGISALVEVEPASGRPLPDIMQRLNLLLISGAPTD